MKKLALLCFLLQAKTLFSASTWSGGGGTGNEQTNSSTNWVGGVVPASGDELIFPSGVSQFTVVNNITPYNLSSTTPSISILDGYTINGSAFTVTSSGAQLVYGGSTVSTFQTGINLNGTFSIVGNTINHKLGGQLTGTGGINLTGNIVLINGSSITPNNYSGTTLLNAGAVLYAGASNSFSTASDVTLSNGSTLSLGVTPAQSFNCSIHSLTQSGSTTNGSTVALGNGTLTILNSSPTSTTFPGQITASNGGLSLASGVTLTLSGNNTSFSSQTSPATVTVASGATLTSASALAFGPVSPGAFVNLSIAGTLDLSNNNLVANALNGAGGINLGGANLTVSAGGSFSGVIGPGAGSLTINNGELSLTGANTFTGTTTIGSGGTLTVGNTSAIGSSSSLNFGSGSSILKVNVAGFTYNNQVNLTSATTAEINLQTYNATLGGLVTGSGTLTVLGAANTSQLTLSGSNNFSGTTTINNATLLSNGAMALGSNVPFILVNNGILNINGLTNTIGSLTGSFGTEVQLSTGASSGTLAIANSGVTNAFYGTISDGGAMAGNLQILGGTVTLMAGGTTPNTYTGTTTLANGAFLNLLSLGSSSALTFNGQGLGTSPTCGGGGTITFGQSFTSSAAINISDSPVCTGNPTQYNGVIAPNTFDVTLTGTITGSSSGNLVFLGPGTTYLNPSVATTTLNTFYIRGGTLEVNNLALGSTPKIQFDTFGGTLQAGTDLTISNPTITIGKVNGTFDMNSHSISVSSQIIGASGNLIVTDSTGNGTLTLALSGLGNNTYAGLTSIYNGTLNAVPGTIPGTATVGIPTQMIFGGAIPPLISPNPIFQCGADFTSTNIFRPAVVLMSNGTIDTAGYTMDISGVVAGLLANTFYIHDSVGTGTLNLSGANIYQGPTVIQAGTLQAGVASTATTGAFGYLSDVSVLGTSTLDLNSFSNTIGSLTGTGAVTLGTGAVLTINNGKGFTFSGNITDTASSGLTLSSGQLTLGGNNTYHGTTTITSGTLNAGSTTALSQNSLFSLGSTAALNLATYNSTIAGLSGLSGATVNLQGATLTINNSGSNTYAGTISSTSSGVLAINSGTQVLSGANTYPGATNVAAGATLEAGAANALSANSVVSLLGAGSTLNLNGHNNTVESLSGGAGTAISVGAGTLTLQNGASNTFSGSFDAASGGLVLQAGTFNLTGSISGSSVNLTDQAGSTLALGTLSASGLSSLGTITNQGAFSANLSNITGTGFSLDSYTQGSSSSLDLTLPNTPPSNFKGFDVTGLVNLGGSLTINIPSPSFTDPVILFQGLPDAIKGTFANATLPAGIQIQYDQAQGSVYLVGGSMLSCSSTWNFPGSANWDVPGYWTNSSCIPGILSSILDTALLPDVVGGGSNINISLSNQAGTAAQNVKLYQLTFSAANTSYSVTSFLGSTLTLDGNTTPKPRIIVSNGSHTIYAPVLLNKDSRLSLAGTLTMGIFSSISDGTAPSTLYISEYNGTAGTFINDGIIAPSNIVIQGGNIINESLIGSDGFTPSASLTIQSRSSNTAPLTISNTHVITAATITVDGTLAPTIINNQGSGDINLDVALGLGEIFSSTGDFGITAATVNNTLGALLFAANGQTLTLTNSQVNNDATSQIGSIGSNLHLVSGNLITSGQVAALNYTQEPAAQLQINVQNAATTGLLNVAQTASLGGSLVVNALPGFSFNNAQSIPIVISQEGFSSQFASTSFTNFPSDIIPELLYSPTEISLSSTPVTQSFFTFGPQITFSSITQHNSFITQKCTQLAARTSRGPRQPAPRTAYVEEEDFYYDEQDDDFYADYYEDYEDNDLDFDDAHLYALSGDGQFMAPQKTAQLAREAGAPLENTMRVYFGPTSDFGRYDTVGKDIGSTYVSVGGLAGFDIAFPSSKGLAGGIGTIIEYRKLWGDAMEHAGDMTVDRVHGSLYGTLLPASLPELYFDLIAGFTYTWDHFTRNTGPNGSLKAKGSTNEAIYDVLAGVEYMIGGKSINKLGQHFWVTPLFHVQYAHDNIDGYKESGAGIYNLKVPSQMVEALGTSLGSRFDYEFNYRNFNFVIEVVAEWQREYLNNKRSISLTPFNVPNIANGTATAVAAPRNGLLASLDLLSTFSQGWQIEANSTLLWNSRSYDLFFYLGAGKQF